MLTISNMTKAFGARVLFEDAALQVNRGDRIGLVGPNGAGKSTLFSLVLGHDTPDTGEVNIERNTTLGHLPQETAPVGEETVLELATAITPEIAELQRRLKAFEAGHDAESHDFHEVQARFDELGGYQLEPKAKNILHGLAFRERDFNRPLKAMSGGWVMRAYLARLLVQEPDLLLLDEPTNHLDLEALRWFQEYLKTYPGAIVLISHDREFLNQLVGSIVDIRQSRLLRYRGNYDEYLVQRAAQAEQHLAAYKNQQRDIQRLQEFADRFRAKASKASQAQAKLKQIERMDKIEAPGERSEDDQVPFSATSAQRPARHHAQGHSPCVRRDRRLSRHELRGRTRPAHRAGRSERRRQVHAVENPCWRVAGPIRYARTGIEHEGRLLRSVSRGNVASRPHRGRRSARHAATVVGGNRSHRARLVPVSRRRRVQIGRRAERRREKPVWRW